MTGSDEHQSVDLDRWVDELSELSGPERAAWFAARPECASHRERLERLLERFDRLMADEDALPDMVASHRVDLPGAEDLPDHVGPYRILDTLGSGGMGVVYLGEQRDPRRRVAVKVLRGGVLVDEVQRRFDREAELLARLQHPGIAQVIESGRAETGESYLVLEWIDGLRLTEHAAEEALSIDARLGLLADLAEAVHHAHLRGVVHRDLKPANVLVTREGRVKVIDFGVARALEADGLDTLETRAGQVVGTLAYMSPEQVRGDVEAIDARADVYALGVLAYELLGGRLPHDLTTTSVPEAARVLAEVEPPTLGRVAAACRGDLEIVVGKALEKDPERRYASAAAFADDLRRVVAGEPIEARAPTLVYQLGKLARRHRGAFAGLVVAVLSLVGGLGAALFYARQSQLDAADADAARMRAEELAVLAEERAAEIERRADPGRLVLARETAEDLWPALPRTVPAYDAWLARYAEPLGANLPDHVRALEELRRDALPYDEEQQIADRAQHPMRPQLEEQEGKIDNAQRQLAGEDPRVPAPEGEDRLYLERALAAMEATADEIRSRLDERLTWRFTDPAVQEQHDHLAGLVRELEAFLGPDGLVDEVRQRRAQAIDVVAETVTDPEPAAEWRHALDDLAQLEVYRGVELAPQVGLRPLRRDPRSGLWEFWLPASGDAPFPTDDGWDLGEESGLVFVLVPGGTDLLGAQADDPQAPNHDPAAKADEGPVRAVTLPAYFVSKYELTQAQWRRLTGETPSQYTPNFRWFGSPPREEAITASGLSNPVESISHAQATRIATSLGLRLPSSEEWEFAARGGTDTPWWTGTTPASLQGAANVADGAVRRQGGPPNWTYTEELEDSYIVHAPVGSFAPNPFGLHDVLGNVWEWTKAQPGSNGLATRGGCYEHPADRARVTSREYGEPTAQSRFVGLRPVRSIAPSPAR